MSNSIEIPEVIDFGVMEINSSKTLFIPLKNVTENPLILRWIYIRSENNRILFRVSLRLSDELVDPPYAIPPNNEVLLQIGCRTDFCGYFDRQMTLYFEGFQILRFISVAVPDLSSPNHTFGNNRVNRRRYLGDYISVVPSDNPFNQNRRQNFNTLGEYSIPDRLWSVLKRNLPITQVFPQLEEPLHISNYSSRFHSLLYLEECESQLKLRQFNINDVVLRRENRLFVVTVKGLREGRPSLIINDKIFVSKEYTENSVRFEGFIKEIRGDELIVRFSDQFNQEFSDEQLFSVEFVINRAVFRFSHNAIDLISNNNEILFPTLTHFNRNTPHLIPCDSIEWFNTQLNNRQKLAVKGVLRAVCRPIPFVIFGPPGTGKTVTIIESILQVYHQLKKSRIIVCTAANVSADLIVDRLLETRKIDSMDLIRVIAFHRVDFVPQRIRSVTKIASEDPNEWLYHRIIVITTSHSGVIFRHNIPFSHFSHLFIDESSQVLEPESLIPISLCLNSEREVRPVIVLTGDHKQLSPFVQSNDAKTCHLNVSLLERYLSSFDPYRKSESRTYGYNHNFVVKLVENYRSDQQIMIIPSKLFYENELIFNVETDHNLLLKLEIRSPVNFLGVRGEELPEPLTNSWFNIKEIDLTIDFLKRLYSLRGRAQIDSNDIGIITPYRRQAKEIRDRITREGLFDCKVGTIEEYKGLEKRIIILSMVRSDDLGFVRDPKRFNVAVSRAKALLMVIGDPKVLIKVECWAHFINYCLLHNCYSGCEFQGSNATNH